jgi:hypothetical protein
MLRAGSSPPPEHGDVADARPLASRLRLPRRAVWISAAVVLGVVVVGILAVGPIVRAKIASEAARRKVEVTVGSVRPGFFTVGLHDVHVKPEGVPGLDAHLDEVRVDLGATLSLRDVVAKGGTVTVEGEPEDLVERLKTFRKSGGGGPPSGGHRTPVSVQDLALEWRTPSGGEISASGIRASRDGDVIRAGCTHVIGRYHGTSLDVVGGDLELGPEGAPRRIGATSVAVTHEAPRVAAAVAPTNAGSAVEPAPPPLPTAIRKGKRGEKGDKGASSKVAGTKASDPQSDEPVLPLPDLHAARQRIAVLASTFGAKVPDGTKIDVGGLSAKLDVGGEPVAFGPGPFTLERRGESIHLGFSSDKATGGGTPLSIDAELPLKTGDVTARLSGGPVSLALLGVKEGTKGLFDVARGMVSGKGQVVLAAAGDSMTFDGEIALRSISLKQPKLSLEPLRGLDFALAARGLVDDAGRLRIDDAQLDMGALHVKSHGTVEETKDHLGLSLQMDLAPAACQALLESAPQGLLPLVRQGRMAGTFGATARVVFDTRTIDKMVLDYQIADGCKMTEVPRELSHDRFTGSFTYTTYHPDGTPEDTMTGPGTPSWTNIDDISPFMISAVLTTEDGAFYKHHGFNHAAIKSSVAANLKARKFIRGASTITMQLAKNLFLSRDKTLGRKIEEVILTDYLEQIFRKDDMMELYLNVIEFGPDVYGITQAADYYFGRKPDELNASECFFLATLLPSPIRYGKMKDKGEISEGWAKHLAALLEIAAKNGKITQAELTEAQGQKVVFQKPGDPRPEPRQPVTKQRRDPYEDDAAWQPLD